MQILLDCCSTLHYCELIASRQRRNLDAGSCLNLQYFIVLYITRHIPWRDMSGCERARACVHRKMKQHRPADLSMCSQQNRMLMVGVHSTNNHGTVWIQYAYLTQGITYCIIQSQPTQNPFVWKILMLQSTHHHEIIQYLTGSRLCILSICAQCTIKQKTNDARLI